MEGRGQEGKQKKAKGCSRGDGEMEFEISEILDSKIDKCHKCRLQYLVKWSGYEGTDEETSWIPASELEHVTESVADFHLANPDKPGPSFP